MNHQFQDQSEDTHPLLARYRQARKVIQGFSTKSLVQNDALFPHWINTDYFWYERAYKESKKPTPGAEKSEDLSSDICSEYRLVNAKTATNSVAFDHQVFADTLASASGKDINSQNLPISYVTISLSPLRVTFSAFDKYWLFDEESHICKPLASETIANNEVFSPDGKWIAFSRDHNLWIRKAGSDEERAVTNDGEENYAYAIGSTAWGMSLLPDIPALWSPDSTRLLTVRRDKRQVKTLPIVNYEPSEHGSRPAVEHVKIAYPGDEHVESYEILSISRESGEICQANYHPMPTCSNDYLGFFGKLLWWSEDNRRAYFIDQERGDQIVRLIELDTNTGNTQLVFEETSDTHINIISDVALPLHRFLPKTNELVWWSERTGWGHLYLYDLNNRALKQIITAGEWRVRDVLHVDEERRELFIQTGARVCERDPYYRDVCRVNIDTGEICTLLSSDHDYVVHYQDSALVITEKMAGRAGSYTAGIAPSGNYLVVTRTRADQASSSLLIDRNGKEILQLESADISNLPETWHWPEPLELVTADGKTKLYGLLFKPSSFDPSECYPLINFIGSGPWLSIVPKGSFHSAKIYAAMHYFYAAALAELGFIVLLLDSRGTALRSKAFQNDSYGWIPASANTDDHATAIHQLVDRHPYIDKERVGIFTRGYRSGLQNFLERQDIYKACVCLCLQDSRLIGSAIEGDKYEGRDGPDKDQQYPEELVDNLEGKLLLMHAMNGYVIPSYPPTATFRMIDAMQKANKDFDLLMVPEGGYMFTGYMLRRAWDFLVKHLQNEEPPKEFELGDVSVG